MENGICPMKKELFDRFLSTYDMEFSEDFCFVAKLKEVLSEEVDAFLWLDKNKQKSSGTFSENQREGRKILCVLFEVQTCFSNDERALLFMIRGIEGR